MFYVNYYVTLLTMDLYFSCVEDELVTSYCQVSPDNNLKDNLLW